MPKDIKVELGSYRRIDIEVAVFLSPNSNGFITSRFNGDELKEVFEGKHHLWIEILNRSFEDNIVVKKKQAFWFSCNWTRKFKISLCAGNEEKKIKQKKRWTARYGRKRQLGGFLSRYDFAYAGRDLVNQAGKVAPGIIKAATKDINHTAEQRLNQLISQGGEEVERVLPNVLRGAIEDIYQTPFRLLGNFGKTVSINWNEKYWNNKL